MSKYTVKEIEKFSNEALIAALVSNATHMAKEQKFPQWALKQEQYMLKEMSKRFDLDLDELKVRFSK